MDYIEQRQKELKHSCAPILSRLLSGNDSSPDANFLINQLAYRENKVFEKLYTPMQYEQFLPITDEAGPYTTEIIYESMDRAGMAKESAGRGGIPLVDVAIQQRRFPVLYGSVGYAFTQEELRQTTYLKRPISERRAGAAMEAYRRHMNRVALFGEDDSGITGLYNNPTVPKIKSKKPWSTASVEEILDDVNTLISTVWENTAYNDVVDTIVLAPKAYASIASRPRSAYSDITILKFIEQNSLAKTTYGKEVAIFPGHGLDFAGIDEQSRMIGYVRSEQRLVMHIPLPLRFLQPQFDGLQIFIPGEYKYSGVEFRYPYSACYMDGI